MSVSSASRNLITGRWRTEGSVASVGIQAAALAVFLGAWYLATANRWISPLILPTLPDLAGTFLDVSTRPSTYHHIRVTIVEFITAMAIALGAGLLLGILAGTVRYVGDLIEPVVLSMYAIPIIMAFPLCILFFGIGSGSKIAFAGVYAFFPIAIQAMKGLRQVEPGLLRVAVSLGASRRDLIWKVMVPAAFPVLMTGVRIGAVLGLLSVVAGEMLASLEGIGHQLSSTVQTFLAAEAFSWILITILLVSLVNLALSWLERRVQV